MGMAPAQSREPHEPSHRLTEPGQALCPACGGSWPGPWGCRPYAGREPLASALCCRRAKHLVLHSSQPQVTGILIMIINILLTMASSTPVLSNEHVENARLTVRPKRVGMPSGKVRSADNAAVPALSSHRAAQAGTTALAKGPSLTVTVTPATTSAIPNDPSVSRPRTPLLPLPRSPTAASTTSTSLGTTTDDDDDVRFELLTGMTRKCE